MPLPIPAPRAEGTTTSTSAPLYWAAYGDDSAPSAVVVHGGPGADHRYLLPQMLRLAEAPAARRLVFYDQRGGGRSRSDDRDPVTWRSHVADLAAVIDELTPAHEPLTLVGYSWGGLLSLLYVIEAAADARLRRPTTLVLLDPAPVTREYRARFEGEFARRQQGDEVKALRDELAASGLRDRDPEAYRQRAFELSVAGYFADPREARELTPFRVVGRVQQSVWESLGDFDLRAAIASAFDVVHCRTLVVHGREDPIPLASSEEVARAAGAELVVLDGSGHVPYVERPDELFAAVKQFLAGDRR